MNDDGVDDLGVLTGGPRVGRWAAVVAAVLLGVLVWVLATSAPASERRSSSPLLGNVVPPLVGDTLDGGTFDVDDYRGQWVLVNFFASWCTACRIEHPELVAFSEEHEGHVQVVSVVFDDSPEAVAAFFASVGGDWPVVIGDTGGIAIDFGVTGVPESYVVAPSGTVVAAFYAVTQKSLNEVLDEMGATFSSTTGGAPTTSGPPTTGGPPTTVSTSGDDEL